MMIAPRIALAVAMVATPASAADSPQEAMQSAVFSLGFAVLCDVRFGDPEVVDAARALFLAVAAKAGRSVSASELETAITEMRDRAALETDPNPLITEESCVSVKETIDAALPR